ncbi:MAG: phage holin family protein [Spongiibacteraceae bacterium]
MSSSPSNPREAGFFDSLRTLTGSVLDLLHVRIELFSVEWQEQQEHGKQLVVLAVAGAMLLGLGLLLLTFFIIVLFWDSYRLLAIAIVTALYFGGGGFCLWRVRAQLKSRPPPFAGSLHEFVEDLKQIKTRDAESRDSDADNALKGSAITKQEGTQ